MLFIAPLSIEGKYKFENGLPVATCDLTEEEQKVFDEFYNMLKEERENKFVFED